MTQILRYDLFDPGYTIYHRAALGGLASTLKAASGKDFPAGIRSEITSNSLRLMFDLPYRQMLKHLLGFSFRLSAEGLIDLPGMGLPTKALGERLAVHNALCSTFLQHNKMRPSESKVRKVSLEDENGELKTFTYKGVISYAHQSAQGTGLDKSSMPDTAIITQALIPGALKGVHLLEAPTEEVILLLFLMVGCSSFIIHHPVFKEKTQACVVIPDVNDLEKFIAAKPIYSDVPSALVKHGYLDRVVSGAEEAALRLVLDLRVRNPSPGVAGFQVITMGKVAWDKNQVNRTASIEIAQDYPELAIFQKAHTYLGKSKIVTDLKGNGFAILTSLVPGLVASNLARGKHWASDFRILVGTKKDFNNLCFSSREGLVEMSKVIENSDDNEVVRLFQGAWRRRLGVLGARAQREGLSFSRLAEVEREQVRSAILRQRVSSTLVLWFTRFCGGEEIQSELFRSNQSFDRLQNLLLFALSSYSKEPVEGVHDE
jgi:CRISPR-associated protein Cas8a1/Csx13